MRALITTNYISTLHHRKGTLWKDWVDSNKGTWVEIDTTHMFNNQYNTKCGMRIFDIHIDKIEGDVRTDKNIFFVSNPNGIDPVKKVDFDDHLKNKRFLSCHSVNGNHYRIARRSNIEFVLCGDDVYLTNNIGYTHVKDSKLSANEKKILAYCVQRIKAM